MKAHALFNFSGRSPGAHHRVRRRTFLGLASTTLAAGAGYTLWPRKAGYEFYSAYGRWASNWIDKCDPPLKSRLVFFSPQTFQMQSFDVPFRVHTGLQNPGDKTQFVLLPRWGDQIALFHRPTGEIRKVQKAGPGRRFFGYGVWDGDGFWTSENDDQNKRGYLVLRGSDLEVRREIPSGGVYPHQVDLDKPGVLLVANSGNFSDQAGSLLWLDAKDGTVHKRYDFPEILGTAGPASFLKCRSGLTYIGAMTVADDTPSLIWRVGADDQLHAIKVAQDQLPHFRGDVANFVECQDPALVVWLHSKTKTVYGIPAAANALALKQLNGSARALIQDGPGVVITRGTAILKWNGGRGLKVGEGPKADREERWGAHIMRALT